MGGGGRQGGREAGREKERGRPGGTQEGREAGTRLVKIKIIWLQIRGPTLALRPRAATSHADDHARVGATHHRVMSGRRQNAAQPLATGGSELGRRTSGSHRGMHAFRQRGVLLTTFEMCARFLSRLLLNTRIKLSKIQKEMVRLSEIYQNFDTERAFLMGIVVVNNIYINIYT